ncbi:MAG: hypothetical protein AAFU77_12885 [Myxococcota bacterium]
MKQAAVGFLVGVILSSGIWTTVLQLQPPAPAPSPELSAAVPTHDLEGLEPDAQNSIRAFQDIARSLDAGSLLGVREKALEIESFFAPMNAEIARSARELAESTEVEAAKACFRTLTEAFQHPPASQPDSFSL